VSETALEGFEKASYYFIFDNPATLPFPKNAPQKWSIPTSTMNIVLPP